MRVLARALLVLFPVQLAAVAVLSAPRPAVALRTVGAPRAAVALRTVGASDRLAASAPAQSPAGVPLRVAVAGAGAGDPVFLQVIGSVGTAGLRSVAGPDGRASFLLPDALSEVAGTVTFLVADGAVTTSGTTVVTPGPAVDPLDAVMGPRSIVADRGDTSMAVAIPVDRFGNAVSDGTPVDLVRQLPSGLVQSRQLSTSHLLVWADVRSGTLAGRGSVRLGVGSATGTPTELLEVAAPPQAIALGLDGRLPAADGQSLITLRTNRLLDRFGNVEPDGTIVELAWQDSSGLSRASATTLDGTARFSIQAPSQADTLTLTAVCRGVTSAQALRLDVPPVTTAVTFTATRTAAVLTVLVGPVLGETGGFVPDGSRVTVSVTGVTAAGAAGPPGSTRSVQAQVSDGTALVRLPASGLPAGPLTVSVGVLGRSATQVLP